MKIAAGCFGCIAFVFLLVALVMSFGITAITQAVPDLGTILGPLASTISTVSSSCCCLSGGLAIVLLVAGSMGKKPDEME